MVFVVDTVEVDGADVAPYLGALGALCVPVMTEAGAALVACRRSHPDAGSPVTVEVTWGAPDYEHWNEIRRRLVLDPRWYEWGRVAAATRRGGTRRFLHDAVPEVAAPSDSPGEGRGAAAF